MTANAINGHRLLGPINSYDDARTIKFFGEIETCRQDHPAPEANFQDGAIVPKFVVGIPRSGTPLIEHILTAHTKVGGTGELSILIT